MGVRFHTLEKSVKSTLKESINVYMRLGRPVLLPITRLLRRPMRWYYHRSPLLRHDNTFHIKPRLLFELHNLFIGEHPTDFTIYHSKLKFRSFGSLMSLHGYYVGEIEYHLIQYIVQQLHPNFVMLDVGAHHGLFTLVVAHELKNHGWNGVIHSFEPNVENFQLLEYNVHENELNTYAVLHQSAVSDVRGEQMLWINLQENADNMLDLDQERKLDNVVPRPVSVVKLDDLLDDVAHINLIKIDVQGGEPQVIKGAEKIIRRDKPIIVTEAVPGWKSSEQVYDLLTELGYTIHGVNAQGELCAVNSSEVFVTWDWVAVPHL